MRRDITSSFDLSPIHGKRIEGPDVIHVCGVCISAKVDDGLIDETTAVTPS